MRTRGLAWGHGRRCLNHAIDVSSMSWPWRPRGTDIAPLAGGARRLHGRDTGNDPTALRRHARGPAEPLAGHAGPARARTAASGAGCRDGWGCAARAAGGPG